MRDVVDCMEKLCIFGDSIGKGVTLPDEGRYRLVKPDTIELVGKEIEIKNYSVFGCTMDKALNLVNRHAEEVGKYDAVLIELGGNDCNFDWQSVSDNPNGEYDCVTPKKIFEKQYTDLINTIKGNGGEPIMVTLPPIVPDRYFSYISKNRDAKGMLKWLNGTQTMYRWQEMYNLIVVELSIKLNVKLIDIRTAFLKNRHYEDFISKDGIHPNEKGYKMIYKTIADFFKSEKINLAY